jgi:hypothetical protein
MLTDSSEGFLREAASLLRLTLNSVTHRRIGS